FLFVSAKMTHNGDEGKNCWGRYAQEIVCWRADHPGQTSVPPVPRVPPEHPTCKSVQGCMGHLGHRKTSYHSHPCTKGLPMLHAYRLLSLHSPHAPPTLWEWEQALDSPPYDER